jgi:hypothetical protein
MVPFVTALTVHLQHSSRCWTVPQDKPRSNAISRRITLLSIWNCSSTGAVWFLSSWSFVVKFDCRPSPCPCEERTCANVWQIVALTTHRYRILPRALLAIGCRHTSCPQKPTFLLTSKHDQYPKRVTMLNCCGCALQPISFESHAPEHQSPQLLSTAQKFQRFQNL